MKHSSSRYRFGDPDIDLWQDRKDLRAACFALTAAQSLVDETIVRAVDDGMSFAKVGQAIGVPKATAYRMYQDAVRRRTPSHARND